MIFIKSILAKASRFGLWTVFAVTAGLATGVTGGLFHKAIDLAAKLRTENGWLIYLLPLGGVLIALMYRLSKQHLSTNTVIECIRKNENASGLLAPFIFAGAFITHLFGGSAGREGAALQIGGGIGSAIARGFKLNKEDAGIMIVAGMSGAFSAIFTTPVTATVFALELVTVGHIRYFQLMPCIISSISAYIISLALGNHRLHYEILTIPEIVPATALKVMILGIAVAFVSIAFCMALHKTENLMHKYIKNDCLRAFTGGCAIIVLTLAVGCGDYNGAGMDIVARAVEGEAKYEAFILKLIFTAITVGAGFKGGEIVPALFVGSTFGVVAGNIIGINPGFAAALGMVGIFCGIANCPLASVMLGIELFGAQGAVFFVLISGISYVISGHFGLYKSQKIVYSTSGINKRNFYVK